MSGHSKWNTIKRKKEKIDAQKGKIFTKIGRELTVAVGNGGPDPDINFRLRECIDKAKFYNVPNENINRVIKKALGEDSDKKFERVFYEGYGLGGVAFYIEALTYNRNRTAADIRKCFIKHGGSLGVPGCTLYLFAERGIINFKRENCIEDEVIEFALNLGVLDVQRKHENIFSMTTEKSRYEEVNLKLINEGYEIISRSIMFIPKSFINIKNDEIKQKNRGLIDSLDDNDDVQNVWCNCKFDE